MKKFSIKELYGLKTAVHSLSFYGVKGIDVNHLDQILSEAIGDAYSDQLQKVGSKGKGFTEEMVSITNSFEEETNIHNNHISDLESERDYDFEMMMMSQDDDD